MRIVFPSITADLECRLSGPLYSQSSIPSRTSFFFLPTYPACGQTLSVVLSELVSKRIFTPRSRSSRNSCITPFVTTR